MRAAPPSGEASVASVDDDEDCGDAPVRVARGDGHQARRARRQPALAVDLADADVVAGPCRRGAGNQVEAAAPVPREQEGISRVQQGKVPTK